MEFNDLKTEIAKWIAKIRPTSNQTLFDGIMNLYTNYIKAKTDEQTDLVNLTLNLKIADVNQAINNTETAVTHANTATGNANTAAGIANEAAANVNSAILSAGDLGSITHNASAPTPGRNGFYIFSDGGVCSWISGTPTVKAGDRVSVEFDSVHSTYSYTWINVPNGIVDDLTTGGTGSSLSAEQGKVLNLSKLSKHTALDLTSGSWTPVNQFTEGFYLVQTKGTGTGATSNFPANLPTPSAGATLYYWVEIKNTVGSTLIGEITPLIGGNFKTYIWDMTLNSVGGIVRDAELALKADKTDLNYVKGLSLKIYQVNPLDETDATIRQNKIDISSAIKEFYFESPFDSNHANYPYQDNLITSIRRNAQEGGTGANKWHVRFYLMNPSAPSSPITTVATLDITSSPEGAAGISMLPLYYGGVVKGYVLIDWTRLTQSTYSGLIASNYYLSNVWKDVNNSPKIRAYQLSILKADAAALDLKTDKTFSDAIYNNLIDNSWYLFGINLLNDTGTGSAAANAKKVAAAVKYLYLHKSFEIAYISIGKGAVEGVAKWYIRIYNSSIVLVSEYSTTTDPGDVLQSVALTKQGAGYDGVAVIDWSKLTNSTAYGSMTSAQYRLSSRCFNTEGRIVLSEMNAAIAAAIASKTDKTTTDAMAIDATYLHTFTRELFAQNPELTVGNPTKLQKLRDVANFFKELWIDSTQVTPQDLYLSLSRSADAGKWYINIWNSAITSTVCQMDTVTVSPEPTPANTLQLIPLLKSGVIKGYAVVDWSALSTSTIYNGIASTSNIEGRLSRECFNENAPLIKNFILKAAFDTSQNKELWKAFMISNFNNTFTFENLLAYKITPKVIELVRNFNVPTTGAYISTDQENVNVLGDTPTTEELQRAYAPYLWIDGVKVGTVVLFDDSGAPFIVNKNGEKKLLTIS